MEYYDDNFGSWNMDGCDREEMVDFYHETQKRSVWKICAQCECEVKILPHYAICNNCADSNERGGY